MSNDSPSALKRRTSLLAVCLLAFLFNASTYAKDLAVVFGGGCDDPETKETQDKPSFAALSRTVFGLKEQGWKVQAYYGRSAWLKKFAKEAGLKKAKLANKKNLIDALAEAEKKLLPGEQFLLYIDTHGSPEREKLPHAICTADDEESRRFEMKFLKDNAKDIRRANDAEGAEYDRIKTKLENRLLEQQVAKGIYTSMKDPKIVDKLKSLQKKGVKVGIIDDSCYGGATVKYFTSQACVLSATTDFQKRPDGSMNGVGNHLGYILTSGIATEHSRSLTMSDLFLATIQVDSFAFSPDMLIDPEEQDTEGDEIDATIGVETEEDEGDWEEDSESSSDSNEPETSIRDVQISSFLSWMDVVNQREPGCTNCTKKPEGESLPEVCEGFQTEISIHKCTGFLRHIDSKNPGTTPDEGSRINRCNAFRLSR